MSEGNRSYLLLITVISATGGFLFGFDMAVISGMLTFLQDQFSLTAAQEGWFVSSALVGCILGVASSGEVTDRLGRRFTMIVAAGLFFISAAGSALAPGFGSLVTARMIGGVAVGILSNVVPLYLSEIAPVHIRGRLVTCYQLAITVGILFAYISNAGVLKLAESAAGAELNHLISWLFADEIWRGMFAVEMVPSLFFLAGIFAIPESPRWLIQQNRVEEGKSILFRISGRRLSEEQSRAILNSKKEEKGSYRELFRPGMRKVLMIGILLPVFSQFSGINAIIYYGPRILSEAGVEVSSALMSQILLGFANMAFTFIAIWKVDSAGRRPLYLFGTAGAVVSLMITGFFFYTGNTGSIFLLISVIAFLAFFAFSIGPLKFVVASEIFPNEIRGRAMAISILAMWIADAVVGQITPMLLASSGAAATFWLFAFFSLVAFLFVYKMVPETKGKSLEEIQQMWQ